MTYDRLIHDYLDEGLSDTMQESLFNELANNSELRNEFNKQLKLLHFNFKLISDLIRICKKYY